MLVLMTSIWKNVTFFLSRVVSVSTNALFACLISSLYSAAGAGAKTQYTITLNVVSLYGLPLHRIRILLHSKSWYRKEMVIGWMNIYKSAWGKFTFCWPQRAARGLRTSIPRNHVLTSVNKMFYSEWQTLVSLDAALIHCDGSGSDWRSKI